MLYYNTNYYRRKQVGFNFLPAVICILRDAVYIDAHPNTEASGGNFLSNAIHGKRQLHGAYPLHTSHTYLTFMCPNGRIILLRLPPVAPFRTLTSVVAGNREAILSSADAQFDTLHGAQQIWIGISTRLSEINRIDCLNRIFSRCIKARLSSRGQ